MSLERIEVTPFSMLAGEIVLEKRTGHLTVVKSTVRRILYWSQGDLVLVTSTQPQDSLAQFAAGRGLITANQVAALTPPDPVDSVLRFRDIPGIEPAVRQGLLRDWISSLMIPLFSLDEGTSAFVNDEAIDPEKRIFLQSTTGLILEGIRTISNGLVLRRSLGDLKREIVHSREAGQLLDTIPLSDVERRIAGALGDPETIENFLKRFTSDSVNAARTVIAMLTLGIFVVAEQRIHPEIQGSSDELERDLALLASIGSQDKRSLRVAGLAKHLGSVDFYELIDAPRASTRNQILARVEDARKRYAPDTYPAAVRESAEAVVRKIEQAGQVLSDANKRQEYDKAIAGEGRGRDTTVQQRVNQRSIAEQNLAKARDLAFAGDYYGAIVLLKQSVVYAPDLSEAWYLLGSCQERNPNWRRDASESFMKTLSINPNHVLAMTSLGDLYRGQGLASRAQSFYEDALKVEPENAQLQKRIKELKK